MNSFSKKLVNWYLLHQRDLPWRNTDNVYKIWLSEIILQQTRVQQGIPYYEKFLDHYPTIYHLADASEDEVLKLWEGLGYYSRARNMHFTARDIVSRLNGEFPDNYKDLLQLKGVGPYTAAAIASFAFKEVVAAIDGNAYRVLARVFGVFDDISMNPSKKVFQSLANDIIPEQNPDIFNQAMMDFGSLICKPKLPLCNECFLQEECFAYRNNNVADLPVKSKKVKVKNRYFNFLLLENEEKGIVIEQRFANDIWKNLYQLPMVEANSIVQKNEILSSYEKQFSQNITGFCELKSYHLKHQLTHQSLYIRFFKAQIREGKNIISLKDIHNYAFPIPIKNFLKNYYQLS